MPRWAITGGSGFVGLHLARRLLEAGVEVCALDLEPPEHAEVEGIVGDVRDPRAASDLCRGAEVVVHAAAALPIRRAAAEIRSVTVDGTATLLAAAAEAGVRRVVFVSSGVVYGVPARVPVTEVASTAPFEAYGRAKVEAERLCAGFRARGVETIVLRPSAVVGPERLGVFGILFDWIRAGRRIYTIGAGKNRYQLLDVADLAEAIVLAGVRAAPDTWTYNVGASEVSSVRAELEALIAHAGSSSRVTPLPAAPTKAVLAGLSAARLSPLTAWHYRTADRDVVLDVSRAAAELGWAAARSSAEALARAYDGFVQRGAAGTRRGPTHRTLWSERALGVLRRVS